MTFFSRLPLILLLALILIPAGVLPPTPLVQAQERGFMGRIAQVEGYGIIVRADDGREVPAAAGLDLFSGDKISAGPLSEVRMITLDGSLFWLGGESIMELGEFEKTSDKGSLLTVNLPAGYLKIAAESFDKSRTTTVQVWTENAVAAISEDAMIVIEAQDGTMVVGFRYPAKVYGREHPDRVEACLDQKICLIPAGRPALPARRMNEQERSFMSRLFTLGSGGAAEPQAGLSDRADPRRGFTSSTTTTTTTNRRPTTTTIISTTTTIVSTTTTEPGGSTTTSTTTTQILPQ